MIGWLSPETISCLKTWAKKTVLQSNKADASTKAKKVRASWMKVKHLVKNGP